MDFQLTSTPSFFIRFVFVIIIFCCYFITTDATVGCDNFKMDFDKMPDRNWTLLACDIVCCKGDQCNNQTVAFPELPTVPGTGSTAQTAQTGVKTDTEPPSHATRHFPAAVVLAIAAIVGTFFFN